MTDSPVVRAPLVDAPVFPYQSLVYRGRDRRVVDTLCMMLRDAGAYAGRVNTLITGEQTVAVNLPDVDLALMFVTEILGWSRLRTALEIHFAGLDWSGVR